MINFNTTNPEKPYELLKIVLDFIGSIAWPVVALIIIYRFKKELKILLTRAKKVELPGGFSIETIDQEIQQAKQLSSEVEEERKPEIQKFINEILPSFETDANKKMIAVGLTPSPSGLKIDYYKDIAIRDPRLALIGLRYDLEIMLRNLAKGFKVLIDKTDSASLVAAKLLNSGSITSRQYELINTLFKICDSAAHGSNVSKEQAVEVLNISEILIKDYIAWLSWGFK